MLPIGLGPVGATLANFLGQKGHRVLVIEKSDAAHTNPRAIALDDFFVFLLRLRMVNEIT